MYSAVVLRSPATSRPPGRAGLARLTAVALLLIVAALVFINRYVVRHDHPLFWDLRVYAGAIRAHAQGLDPYRSDVLTAMGVDTWFNYTSPPLVDSLFRALSGLPAISVWFPPLHLLGHFGGILAIILVSTTLFLGSTWTARLAGLAVYLLMFGTAGMDSVAAANNGTLLYGLIMLCAYQGFTKRRWSAFHVMVAIASAVKPIYAPLWLLPVFAHGFCFRQLCLAIAGSGIAAASYLAYGVLDPALLHEWFVNLQVQAGQSTNDLGCNVFAAAYFSAGHTMFPALLAQLAFDVLLVTLVVAGPYKGRIRWAALLVTAIFVNPRLMSYDVALASVPLVFLAGQALPVESAFLSRMIFVGYPLILGCLVLPYRSVNLIPAHLLYPALALAISLAVAFRCINSHASRGSFDETALDSVRI